MAGLRSAFFSIGFLLSAVVGATPISYEFTTSWNSGQLAGSRSTGQFAYDSALAQPNSDIMGLDLFTGFDFTFKGVTYTEATIQTGWMRFDEKGDLRTVIFGNNCSVTTSDDGEVVGAGCGVSGRSDEFFIAYSSVSSASSVAGYGITAGPVSRGTTTIQRIKSPESSSEIPEPYSLSIFAVGLALIGLRRFKTGKFREGQH